MRQGDLVKQIKICLLHYPIIGSSFNQYIGYVKTLSQKMVGSPHTRDSSLIPQLLYFHESGDCALQRVHLVRLTRIYQWRACLALFLCR